MCKTACAVHVPRAWHIYMSKHMVVVLCVMVSSTSRLMYSAFTFDRAVTVDVSAMTNIHAILIS
jgi:hypothetical protein